MNNLARHVRKLRADEQLRQERELFDQHKLHEARWFGLRLLMGYSSVLLLLGVMLVASYILLHHQEFPNVVIVAAGAALFTDVLGMLIGFYNIALNPMSVTQVAHLTTLEPKPNERRLSNA